MTPIKMYKMLDGILTKVRDEHDGLTESALEDYVLDCMDVVWGAMTADERQAIDLTIRVQDEPRSGWSFGPGIPAGFTPSLNPTPPMPSDLAALVPAPPTGLAVQTSTSTYAWVEPREVASAILRAVHDRMAADEYGELVDPEDETMLEAVAGVLRRGGR